MDKQTQSEAIMQYMREHGSISSVEAMLNLGVGRLASRIHDMRGAGIKIVSFPVTVESRWGKSKITRYKLGE